MLQRQVKSLLTNTVLLLSNTRLVFRWKKWDSFLLHVRQQLLGENASCLRDIVHLASCAALFPRGLPSAVTHCQPTAGKVLLLQGCSMSPERAVALPYMQTSTLIFSAEVAAGVRAPLTEAVAISWWLRWRTPMCTQCVPFAAPEQSLAASCTYPRNLSVRLCTEMV